MYDCPFRRVCPFQLQDEELENIYGARIERLQPVSTAAKRPRHCGSRPCRQQAHHAKRAHAGAAAEEMQRRDECGSHLSGLPDELLGRVVSFLSAEDLTGSAALVSRSLRAAADASLQWKCLFSARWGFKSADLERPASWKVRIHSPLLACLR